MDKAEVKKCKKTLNILKIAATDKENITSRIHKKKMIVNNVKTSVAKKNKKNAGLDIRIGRNTSTANLAALVSNKNKPESASVVASDLTAEKPSENYWQNLAESCRSALDEALKENIDLHNRISELEYENSNLKAMLNDAKSLVELLTEMLEENKDEAHAPEEEEEEEEEEQKTPEETAGDTSDSDLENTSFQSCIQ